MSVTLAVWPETVTVEGVIRDTAGAPVSGEKVALVDVNCVRRETDTDDTGHYRFQDVPHGMYKIQARGMQVEGDAQGFLVWRVITGLTVSQPPPTPVVIFTFHNKFVAIDPTGVLKGDIVAQEGAEKFTLIYLGDKAALRTSQGRYVSVMPGDPWPLKAEMLAQAPGSDQQFTLINLDDGRVALRTVYNKYLTALNDEPGRNWEIRASADEMLAWEKFTLIPGD